MDIDARVLIELIKSRSVLWDKKNRSYHHRTTVEKTWLEVSRKLKIPKLLIKKKWKYLRDQFRSECKKIPAEKFFDSLLTAADYDGYTSWPYFKKMFFLKSQIKCRKLKRLYLNNKDGEQMDDDDDQDENNDTFSAEDSKDVAIINAAEKEEKDEQDFEKMFVLQNIPTISATDYEAQTAQAQPSKEANNSFFLSHINYSKSRNDINEKQDKFAKLERKLDILVHKNRVKYSEQEMDEDRAFFHSLLPHLKTLTPAQKLLCRIDIQTNVYKHAYSTLEKPQPAPIEDSQDKTSLDNKLQ